MSLKPNYLKPIKEVIRLLKSKNIYLSNRRALEFFARKGDWHTLGYCSEVKSLDAWEIDPIYENDLNKNLPNAKVVSFNLATHSKFAKEFDFIVFDNPMGYGSENKYCEHFDPLRLVELLSSSDSVVIFNVNFNPFGMEKSKAWFARRNQFYGIGSSDKRGMDFLLKFYTSFFSNLDFLVSDSFFVKRTDAWGEGERVAYFVYKITRK